MTGVNHAQCWYLPVPRVHQTRDQFAPNPFILVAVLLLSAITAWMREAAETSNEGRPGFHHTGLCYAPMLSLVL